MIAALLLLVLPCERPAYSDTFETVAKVEFHQHTSRMPHVWHEHWKVKRWVIIKRFTPLGAAAPLDVREFEVSEFPETELKMPYRRVVLRNGPWNKNRMTREALRVKSRNFEYHESERCVMNLND